jgi:predicted small lipoprotein YifL
MIRSPYFRWTVLALSVLVFADLAANGQTGTYLPPGQYGAPPDDQPRSIRPPQGGDTYGRGGGDNPGYGQPYSPPPPSGGPRGYDSANDGSGPPPQPSTYSSSEIVDTGHHFFGNVSEGLAKVVEHSFKRNGRPNGYILGEEAGGAVIAGLRYGEGTLYTKGFPPQKVYWQGPSVGYDFGANGSKSLTLVYNIQYPSQIYERFAGVDGAAYLVGGVGITFQQHDDVILAPIRAGVGLRLGANVGYLKYTPSPTWNPF